MIRALFTLVLALICGASVALAQAPTPLSLAYEGYLTDLAHQPISGERDILFRLYSARAGGAVVWEEALSSVSLLDGTFNVNLGLTSPLPLSEPLDAPLYLSIQVEGDLELYPRLLVGAAIRSQWAERAVEAEVALVADHAPDVRGQQIHPATVSIGDREVINAQGEWVGAPVVEAGEPVQGPQGPQGPQGETGAQGPLG